jgi:hypothetical protein
MTNLELTNTILGYAQMIGFLCYLLIFYMPRWTGVFIGIAGFASMIRATLSLDGYNDFITGIEFYSGIMIIFMSFLKVELGSKPFPIDKIKNILTKLKP